MVPVGTLIGDTDAVKIAENTTQSSWNPGSDDVKSKTYVINQRAANGTVYFGKSENDATVNDGFEWHFVNGPITVELEPGEALWVIAAAGTTVYIDNVLVLGR